MLWRAFVFAGVVYVSLPARQIESGSLSVLQLKQKLADVFDIPVGEQSVVYRGKALLGESAAVPERTLPHQLYLYQLYSLYI